MSERKQTVVMNHNGMNEFFNEMAEDYVYMVTIEVPYIMEVAELETMINTAKEFGYVLEESFIDKTKTKMEFYQELSEEHEEERSTNIELSYNGLCDFFNGVYEEEHEMIEIEIPSIVTKEEIDVMLAAGMEFDYAVTNLHIDKEEEVTLIEFDFIDEVFIYGNAVDVLEEKYTDDEIDI